MAGRIVPLLILLLVVSCADGGDGEPSAEAPADFVVGGDRPVTVHVLARSEGSDPAPLLIVLHGYGSTGAETAGYLGLDDHAEVAGMLTAYPDGTPDASGKRYWNVTDADVAGSGVDDVGYLAGLVGEIAATVAVEPGGVYLLGHSNGAEMAYRAACDRADLFAAVVSLAGTIIEPAAGCRPSQPVAILEIHGTADDVVRYRGGSFGSVEYPSVDATASTMLGANGCDPGLAAAPDALDLDRVLPGPETTVRRSTGCPEGGHVEVWTIVGGSHIPDLSPTFAEAVVGFLLDHARH